MFHLTRRSALLGLVSAFTLGRASLALANAPTDKRFVVVIQRGALDGLSAVVPYGDPALAGLRGELVPPAPSQDGGMLDLGGFYGLHASLTQSARDVPGGRTAAGARRRRPLSGAQPFRGPGLPGKRRRPPHDQWLAEPRGCRHACRRAWPARGRRTGDRRIGAAAAARPRVGGKLGAARICRAGTGSVRPRRGAQPG